jgi:hypothetical protein
MQASRVKLLPNAAAIVAAPGAPAIVFMKTTDMTQPNNRHHTNHMVLPSPVSRHKRLTCCLACFCFAFAAAGTS